MKREYESCSSISLYHKCPAAYAFKHRDHLPDPSGPEAAFGTEYHEAVYASWHSRSSEHPDERIARMLALLYSDERVAALPRVKLEHGVTCEKEIMVMVAGTMMKGYIDIDLREYGVPFLIDLKSSSKFIDSRKLKTMYQHKHYPTVTDTDKFLYLLVTAPKMQQWTVPIPLEEQLEWTPELQWKMMDIGPDGKLEWEDEIRDTTFRIALDHFPTNKTPLCSWCPFKKVCPEFNHMSES